MKTIYVDGRVFTGALPLQEAFIVQDGQFIAAGISKDMLALRDEADQVISLEFKGVARHEDGSINLQGFLELKDSGK